MATTKQLGTLTTLFQLTENKGYPPTVREMATARKVTPATIQQSLGHLRTQQLVSHMERSPRSWLITPAGLEALK